MRIPLFFFSQKILCRIGITKKGNFIAFKKCSLVFYPPFFVLPLINAHQGGAQKKKLKRKLTYTCSKIAAFIPIGIKILEDARRRLLDDRLPLFFILSRGKYFDAFQVATKTWRI